MPAPGGATRQRTTPRRSGPLGRRIVGAAQSWHQRKSAVFSFQDVSIGDYQRFPPRTDTPTHTYAGGRLISGKMCPGRAPKPGGTARSAQFERQETGSTVADIVRVLALMQRTRHTASATDPARETLKTLPRRNGFTAKSASIAIGPNQAQLHQYVVRDMPNVPGRPDRDELASLLNCNPPKRSATARHRRTHSRTPGWAGFGRRLYIICVLCNMGSSMNCMRFACRPSIWVDRSSSSVRCNAYFPANGRRLNPSNTSHAGDAMGPPRPFSPYPCRPVTRLKHHPVPVRTVARSRLANRLVSQMSRVENPRKCLPNGNSGHLRARKPVSVI